MLRRSRSCGGRAHDEAEGVAKDVSQAKMAEPTERDSQKKATYTTRRSSAEIKPPAAFASGNGLPSVAAAHNIEKPKGPHECEHDTEHHKAYSARFRAHPALTLPASLQPHETRLFLREHTDADSAV